jgi:hypothetical protein
MAYITETEPVATDSRNSLCCNAPINEQFSTCTDCGEHAELSGPSTEGATFAESKAPQMLPDIDPVNVLLAKSAAFIAVACFAAFIAGFMTGGLGQ